MLTDSTLPHIRPCLAFSHSLFSEFELHAPGVGKALLGSLMFPAIAALGLELFSRRRRQTEYYEPELREFEVVYDQRGFPVHPRTRIPVLPMGW